MSKSLITLAVAALGIPLLGGAAMTAANSVSVEPAPAVVLPATTVPNDIARSQTSDNTTANTTGATTGDTTVASTEDRVGRTGSTTGNRIHDGSGRGGRGADDDPATHDVNDDHGGDRSRGSDDSKPHAGVDDHGGQRGGG